ncbi:MAG: PAS domain S-box protein [Thaumarchaeota archaeon]|nr:PAS domain S-box protein [Nitrososphaerota archaeon]
MIQVLDENSDSYQYVCISHKENILNKKNGIRLKFTGDIRHALDEHSILAITDATGNIIYANKKFCDLSKYSIEELLGNNHRILKSGYHDNSFYENMWDTISNGKTWHGDIKNKAKDGTFYWLKTTIMPIFNNSKKISHYIAIRTDITEIIEIREKLIKAERLSVIGKLASRMSHDIQNPLSVLLISLENLKMLYGADKRQIVQIEKMRHSIDRISHQVARVLDFVKGRPAELGKINMSEIITDSLDSLIIPNNIQLLLPKNNFGLIADKQKLAIVMGNLILNGVQAIEGTGTIEITVEENNDDVIIQVKDSSPGIPEDIIGKIFDPLFTTKQTGTGLGLASVKSIIELHGGIISVTSPPTIFTITLPKTLDGLT